jgi:hypothetical protein
LAKVILKYNSEISEDSENWQLYWQKCTYFEGNYPEGM